MKEEGKEAKFVYYALIITFVALYSCVAFVSTLHAITFFQLANNLTLSIFLGAAFEIGQASVLFSILMTKNKNRTMAWAMMFLLTTLQITANVFASFKFMDQSGATDWTYWQRSILFWLEADTPEIYKVTIAWITGALLPIVALGMTALAADNIKLNHERVDLDYDEEEYDRYDDYEDEDSDEDIDSDDKPSKKNDKLTPEEEKYRKNSAKQIENTNDIYNKLIDVSEPAKTEKKTYPKLPADKDINEKEGNGIDFSSTNKLLSNIKEVIDEDIQPANKTTDWHLKKAFVDNDGNVFNNGKFSHKIASKEKIEEIIEPDILDIDKIKNPEKGQELINKIKNSKFLDKNDE